MQQFPSQYPPTGYGYVKEVKSDNCEYDVYINREGLLDGVVTRSWNPSEVETIESLKIARDNAYDAGDYDAGEAAEAKLEALISESVKFREDWDGG